MIVVYHHSNYVTEVAINHESISSFNGILVTKAIPQLAKLHPNQLLVWCHEWARNAIDLSFCENELDDDRKLVSYLPYGNFLPNEIGYVEESIFININKSVRYPTWQMSSLVGGMQTSIIQQIESKAWDSNNLDISLNTIAKNYQPKGLFCYSEPKLLKKDILNNDLRLFHATTMELFAFVAKNYKKRWLFLLVLNYLIYQRSFPFFSFFKNIFKSKVSFTSELHFSEKTNYQWNPEEETIDVVIPTIGRKQYLYDVLIDLSQQTHLPKNVIIVEQNPIEASTSELDYLENKTWPFQIKHVFTHQTGACQARNKALALVDSKWVFLADDDIRISSIFLKDVINNMHKEKLEIATIACLRKNQKSDLKEILQWGTFGSGCSILKASIAKSTPFDTRFEHGFGEDADFGMQLRNFGNDIVFFPSPVIKHLKAPIGGFRFKPLFPWENEKIPPKPSPTVMLFHLLHKTQEQINGYKTILFFKYYFKQCIRNPWKYLKYFGKQWELSLKWANILKEKHAM